MKVFKLKRDYRDSELSSVVPLSLPRHLGVELDVTTSSRWKCVLAHEAMRHTTVMKRFPNEDSANATCTTWDVS